MESLDVKERFIELRAKGYSFDKISKELGKAKQTLIDWSRELQEEIASRKALELESLYDQFSLLKEHRLRHLGQTLQRLQTEITSRDLSDVPTEKLLDLQLKYLAYAQEEIVEPVFKSSEEIAEDQLDRELLEELTATPFVRRLKAV